MSVEIKVKFSPEFERNLRENFGDGGALQEFIDATILESIDPYLPFDQGELIRSGLLNTRIGSGELVWRTPYAQYLYHGLLMVDPETGSPFARKGVKKVLASPEKLLNFQKKKPHSGSHWPERWMADNLKQFEEALQNKAAELMRKGR